MKCDPDGRPCTVLGEFVEVDRPRRLRYTRRWEGGEEGDSLVDVRFVERDGRTTVLLEHTGLPTAASRAEHERGWGACLENLQRRVLGGLAGRPA